MAVHRDRLRHRQGSPPQGIDLGLKFQPCGGSTEHPLGLGEALVAIEQAVGWGSTRRPLPQSTGLRVKTEIWKI
jgi:hypothetical protein